MRSGTGEAFAAFEATLPKESTVAARPDGKGGYGIVLPHDVIDSAQVTGSI